MLEYGPICIKFWVIDCDRNSDRFLADCFLIQYCTCVWLLHSRTNCCQVRMTYCGLIMWRMPEYVNKGHDKNENLMAKRSMPETICEKKTITVEVSFV